MTVLTKRDQIYNDYIEFKKEIDKYPDLKTFIDMIPVITKENLSEKLNLLLFIFPSAEIDFKTFEGLCSNLDMNKKQLSLAFLLFKKFLVKIYSV